MSTLTVFFSTFLLVFIGELGDKTQIAAGTGTLANQGRTKIIFSSSALALMLVAALTVFFAGLIPEEFLPTIVSLGGALLILYGGYLFYQAGGSNEDNVDESGKNGWTLFISHFTVVFIAELGDKTQIATLAAAIENQSYLLLVFLASASALVTVTLITVWGATKIPDHWVPGVQKLGSLLMVAYASLHATLNKGNLELQEPNTTNDVWLFL